MTFLVLALAVGLIWGAKAAGKFILWSFGLAIVLLALLTLQY